MSETIELTCTEEEFYEVMKESWWDRDWETSFTIVHHGI